jgi:uroporphyrinogen decarboxylase
VGFNTLYTGTSLADFYGKPKVAYEAQKKTTQDFGWVFLPFIMTTSLLEVFGGEMKLPSGEFDQSVSMTRYPVETVEDAMNLKVPAQIPLTKELQDLMLQEKLDNQPWNIMPPIGSGVFTFAGMITPPEKLCKWTLKKPEAVHHLMRVVTDFTIDQAQNWKDTFGTEGILPWSAEPTSANQLISANQFEEFVLPYMKEAQEKMLAMGYKTTHMHICGEHNDNLIHWTKIPFGDPGIVSFGHEIELETAARYFPNDIILGNLEPVIIQVGTPDEVYEATRVVVEKGKNLPTGYIFSCGCEMPPKAPIENVKAMTKAVNDFGWYD